MLQFALLPGLLAGPLATVHAELEGDPDCDVTVVSHDPDAHVIGSRAASPTDDREHCYTCHWSRSFGSPLAPEAHPGLAAPRGTRVHVSLWLPDGFQAVSGIPARSPPV